MKSRRNHNENKRMSSARGTRGIIAETKACVVNNKTFARRVDNSCLKNSEKNKFQTKQSVSVQLAQCLLFNCQRILRLAQLEKRFIKVGKPMCTSKLFMMIRNSFVPTDFCCVEENETKY